MVNSDFMIDYGLTLAGATPSGSIFSTAAKSAQQPFQRYKTVNDQKGIKQTFTLNSGVVKL